ncbi:MAG: hypothetical protein LBF75_06165 [Treponema sp.]|jgi:hypothetical protein|nr:hypothetical protein [Treponema sp.]
MALHVKVKVPMPTGGVTTRVSGPYQYVYKVLKCYRNSQGQPTNERVPIGKRDRENGMLIPNNRYYAYYGDGDVEVTPTYEPVRSIGGTFFIRCILKDLGIAAMLEKPLGKRRGQAALTACVYMACRGKVMEHLLDFCRGYTLNETPFTSQGASSLFASITHDERMAFFRERDCPYWVGVQPG